MYNLIFWPHLLQCNGTPSIILRSAVYMHILHDGQVEMDETEILQGRWLNGWLLSSSNNYTQCLQSRQANGLATGVSRVLG